jgi:transcriptional regulator with XRE-family HTH domain
MNIKQYDRLLAKLKALSIERVHSLATKSGVPFNTIIKIRNGQTNDPRIMTVLALAEVL